MKDFILALFVIVLANRSAAQETTLHAHSVETNLSDGRLELYLAAYFTIGGGINCPPMVWSQTTNSPDTLRIQAVYNTYGTWPMFGCTSLDTIIFDPYGEQACVLEIGFFDHQAIGELSSDTVQAGSPQVLTICTVGQSEQRTPQPTIAPNPFADHFTISDLFKDVSAIALWDATGRIVIARTIHGGEPMTIQASDLSNGIYYLHIHTDTGVSSRMVVKAAP